MADKRLVPDPLIYDRQGDTTVLRPQAQPVDNFIRATEPIKSPLWDVATSLAQVNPKIHSFLEDQAREGAAQDSKEAEVKAMSSSAKSWQEAIDKGEVSAGASPIYQRVFQETLGKTAALTSAQASLTAKWYDPSNTVRNSQDPEAISKWMQENTADLLKDKPLDWQKGFIPQLTAVKQQLTQHWIAENVQNLQEDNKNAFGALMLARIQSLSHTMGPDQIANTLASDAIPQRFAGLKKKEINAITAQSIITAAELTGNASLLKIGYSSRPDVQKPGEVIPGVFSIPEYAAKALSAQTAILAKANHAESLSYTRDAKAREQGLIALNLDIVKKKLADPTYTPTNDELAKAASYGTHGLQVIQSNVASVGKQLKPFDPAAYGPISQRILEAGQPGSDTSASEKLKLAAEAYPYHNTASGIDAVNRALFGKENGEASLLHTDIFKNNRADLDKFYPALEKRLDAATATAAVNGAKAELAKFVIDYDANHKGPLDSKEFNDAVSKKAQELGAKFQEQTGAPAPGPAKPGAPGVRPGTTATPAAAPAPTAAPSAPASIADSIPVDRIIPVTKQITLPGSPLGGEWKPKTTEGLDFQSINILRSNPDKDVGGKPLWQLFDERYGEGASAFLMKANQGEINFMLKKSKFSNAPGSTYTNTLDNVGKVLTSPVK